MLKGLNQFSTLRFTQKLSSVFLRLNSLGWPWGDGNKTTYFQSLLWNWFKCFTSAKRWTNYFLRKTSCRLLLTKSRSVLFGRKTFELSLQNFKPCFILSAHAILKRTEKINYLITRIVIETNWETHKIFSIDRELICDQYKLLKWTRKFKKIDRPITFSSAE